MDEKIKKNLPFIIFGLIFLLPILGKQAPIIIIIAIISFFIYKQIKGFNINNLPAFFKAGGDNFKNMSQPIDLDKLKHHKKFKHVVGLAVLLIFLIWLFFASIQIVDAGQTGVYSLFGKVKDAELRSGFHLVIPVAKVTRMSIRTEEYTMSVVSSEGQRSGDDAIVALTKEGLNVSLDMTVLYRLQEEKASDVYRELGLNYGEKIIRPTIRTAIRDIIAQYEAKDIYSDKRSPSMESHLIPGS